jgi:DNA-binding beta-propeller fold protein YncE
MIFVRDESVKAFAGFGRRNVRWLIGSIIVVGTSLPWIGGVAGCARDRSDNLSARTWGSTGRGQGEFSYPRAMTVGADGLIYIVDKVGRIQSFTVDGSYVDEWSMPDIEKGKPTGLGADSAGKIYVADTHYSRVMIFTLKGELVRQFGGYGEGPGEFILPNDVLVDSDEWIYVCEYGGNDRISKFDMEGRFVKSFGGVSAKQGALNRPTGMAMSKEGVLYVADTCGNRICKYDREGEFLGSFGELGELAGQVNYPRDISIGNDGTIWVAEFGNNRIQQFSKDGRSLNVWGKAGRRPGEFAYPWAILALAEEVFVLDSGNNRVQAVGL